MAWLEAHDELIDHPKVAVLGSTMGWNKFETVGRLIGFWTWVLRYAPTGDLRKFNDAALGSAVALNGADARRWVGAMVEAGWLDRGENTFRVHDWPQYAARYLRDAKFKGRPDKWKEVLAVYADSGSISGVAATERAAERTSDRAGKSLRSSSGVFRATNQTELPTDTPLPRARRGETDRAAGKEEATRLMLRKELDSETGRDASAVRIDGQPRGLRAS